MFSVLTYPVQQSYRLRWITELFYAGSAILIVLLVVFNLALVGYESVSFLSSDPNITDYAQWWAPERLPSALKIRTKPGECAETKLPQGIPLRTNSALPLFSYTLANTFNQPGSSSLHKDPPYQANPLNSCQVKNMTFTMEPRILSFKIEASILCGVTEKSPVIRKFETLFERAEDSRFRPDSILDYLAYKSRPNETNQIEYAKISKSGPPANTFLNVLGVVDMLGSDLIRAMTIRKVTWLKLNTTNQSPVPELGYMAWDSLEDERVPTDASRLLNWGTFTEGNWYKGNYVRTMNASVANMFVAVRDAIHLDLGNITTTNIYLNKSAFDFMITPDRYISSLLPIQIRLYPDDARTGACSWAWGCSQDFNTSWAQALTSTNGPVNNLTLPIAVPSPSPPTVIDMVYLCPQYKRKSWGSLVVSVFVGTFTMYVSIYGIFAWLAPQIDRKRKGPQPWERKIAHRSHDYDPEVANLGSQTLDYTSAAYSPYLDNSPKEYLLSDVSSKRS